MGLIESLLVPGLVGWFVRWAEVLGIGIEDGGSYKPTLPPSLLQKVDRGRIRVTAVLARKLAGHALHVWGETMMARSDCESAPGLRKARKRFTGERQFVGDSTQMYPRVGADGYKPGDDPCEAAFWFLQVEALLIGFEQVSTPLDLDQDQRDLVVRVLGGSTREQLASTFEVPVCLIERWEADIADQLRQSLRHGPRQDSTERLYCLHRFVNGRAPQAFAHGLAIERNLVTELAVRMRQTWGATIPIEVARQMYGDAHARRRASKNACDQSRRESLRKLRKACDADTVSALEPCETTNI